MTSRRTMCGRLFRKADLAILLALTAALPVGKASAQSPSELSMAMAKAVKDQNVRLGARDSLPTDEQVAIAASLEALATVWQATGVMDSLAKGDGNLSYGQRLDRALSGRASPQLMAVAMQTTRFIASWFMGRRPLRPEVVAEYQARLKAVDSTTLSGLRTEQSRVRGIPRADLLMVLVAFVEPFWDGGAWKPGYPGALVARLGSMPSDAITQWGATAGSSQTGQLLRVWSLLTVDGLFEDNIFQQSRFAAAFAGAVDLLKAP